MNPFTLASLTAGPVKFDNPHWLWLIPILGVLSIWIARRSLSGLAGISRWVSLGIRLVVIALVAGALAEPQWQKTAKDVAVVVVLDVSDSIPGVDQLKAEQFLNQAVAASQRERTDRLGVVTTAREAYVQSLPTPGVQRVERGYNGRTDATNLAEGVRLALGLASPEAATRLVLVSDGNQTMGNLLEAASAARAAGIPIWIKPFIYRLDREVLMDRLIAPAAARVGETITVKVVLQATTPAKGTLSLSNDGGAIDLDPSSPATGLRVDLHRGANVLPFSLPADRRGPLKLEAVFTPESGDTRPENNKQTSVTFVGGEGSMLVLREAEVDADALVRELKAQKVPVDVKTVAQAERDGDLSDLISMSTYDGIILCNEPRQSFTPRQIEDMKRYVSEAGGGLMMIGGPDSLGAGGWMDTPLAEALPLDLNPPQKEETPRGALAILVHSVEMPQGQALGAKVCAAALDVLDPQDLFGLSEMLGGPTWSHPLSLVGDKSSARRSINKLQFGDMQDFTPLFLLMLPDLKKANVGQRHVIIISDGDPQLPSAALLQQYKDARITISTVAIACHGVQNQQTMKQIALFTGGRFYEIDPEHTEKVPQIFTKEALTVRKDLIRDGEPFTPRLVAAAAENFSGITGLPRLTGYVRTASRGGGAVVTILNDEKEPLMAQWQVGLGRTIVFASDTGARWAHAWQTWPQFGAFWVQQARWIQRPTDSQTLRVSTESAGDESVIVVDAVSPAGERMSFLTFDGRLASPDGRSDQPIVLREVGPGRYEGRVRTPGGGTSIASLRYRSPKGDGTAPIEGSVQAAINRPFADEYRTLQDNSALLNQVRDRTGDSNIISESLPLNPSAADLWSKTGLNFPTTSRSIWPFVSALALGLFLIDVGVRRVRIDLLALARGAGRLLSRSAEKSIEITKLREAREKARREIADRTARGRPPGEQFVDDSPVAADVKFEASADELKAARNAPIIDAADPAKPKAPPPPRTAKQDAEQGMSALLRAKKRARDELRDQ